MCVRYEFLDKYGQWLRHNVRTVVFKQCKRPKTIYRNLQKLNRIVGCNFSDEESFKAVNSRLGFSAAWRWVSIR